MGFAAGRALRAAGGEACRAAGQRRKTKPYWPILSRKQAGYKACARFFWRNFALCAQKRDFGVLGVFCKKRY